MKNTMENITNLLERHVDQAYDPERKPIRLDGLEDELNEMLSTLESEKRIDALQAIITRIDDMPFEVNMFLRPMRNRFKETRSGLLSESVINGKTTTPATSKAKGKRGNPDPVPNATGERMKAVGEKNKADRDFLIETAKNVMSRGINSGKSRSFYITKSNKASARLYNHPGILSKCDQSKKGNWRGWLNKAIKDGEL